MIRSVADAIEYNDINGFEIAASEKNAWYKQAIENLKITKADESGRQCDAMASYIVSFTEGDKPRKNLLKCYSKYGVQFWILKLGANSAMIYHYA